LDDVEKYCDRVAIIKSGNIMDIKSIKELNEEAFYKIKYTEDEKEVSFVYKEDINKLIKDLSKKKIENLEIKKESLHEKFIKYYGGDDYE
jgi:ABC-2 type transport system ATP-binding protein